MLSRIVLQTAQVLHYVTHPTHTFDNSGAWWRSLFSSVPYISWIHTQKNYKLPTLSNAVAGVHHEPIFRRQTYPPTICSCHATLPIHHHTANGLCALTLPQMPCLATPSDINTSTTIHNRLPLPFYLSSLPLIQSLLPFPNPSTHILIWSSFTAIIL